MVSRKGVSAFLLVVGVVLLALSAIPINEPASNYRHVVEYAGDGRVAGSQYEEEDVIDYGNLSERGQTVFERARGQSEYVVENESATAPEFDYASDAFSVGSGIYPIRYEGEVYELTTSRSGGVDIAVGLAWIAQRVFRVGGVAVLGAGVIVAGWYRLDRSGEAG